MDPYATSETATLVPGIDEESKSRLANALRELGVTEHTLTAEQKTALDRDGYVIIPNAITTEQAAHLADRLEAIAAAEGDKAGTDFHTEAGATRLGTLMNKDPDFDVCYLHPAVLASVNHIMKGNFGLSSLTGRAAQPGEGLQGLHRDHGDYPSANALWVLSDFTKDNGPTRLISGSNHWTKEREPQDKLATHPEETYIIAPAGTLVVIDGRTWHGGTRNNTQKNRHLLSAFFTERNNYQGIAVRKLNPAAKQRLSKAAQVILDFEE